MGYKYEISEYKIIPEDTINKIHDLSLKILQNIGLKVPNSKILENLYFLGASIDKNKKLVKFPEDLVSKSIENSNKKHILYGRNRNNMAEFGLNMFNFNGSSGQFAILDKSGIRRKPTINDLENAIKVGEFLQYVNITGALVVPHDIPQDVVDIYTFYKLLTTTSKPFTGWIFKKNSAKAIIEMMQIVAGSKEELQKYPYYETFIEPISPLSYREESLEILTEFANAGLPVGFSPMVQVGATGPCNLLGTIAQENAEILSGIIIAQSLNPGLPVSYGGIAHIFDMKSQSIVFGSPEQALMAAALTQLGRYYGFPVYNNTFITDSNLLDTQYGVEAAATLALGSLSHGDIFGHLGICGEDSAASLLKLIIDDEIAGYFVRFMSGFSAMDIDEIYNEIYSVGIGGNFLASEITVKKFKTEIWYPELFVRLPWGSWCNSGKKSLIDSAALKLESILGQDYEFQPVENSKLKELCNITRFFGIDV